MLTGIKVTPRLGGQGRPYSEGETHLSVEPDEATSHAKIREQSFRGSMNSNYKGVRSEGSRSFI